MSNQITALDWVDFQQGRIRAAGGRRGRDEPPIQTISVELGGQVYYGEIRRAYLADGNRYNLEIVSFGWIKREWLGTEPDPRFCATFTPRELAEVQSLVCQVIPVWRSLVDAPTFLYEPAQAGFMGEVIFRDGWALVDDDEAEA